MISTQPTAEPSNTTNGHETPVWGWLLTLWMALTIVLHGLIWTTGVPDFGLAQAVEKGAAEVERQQLGEESEDVVRKAIEMQRDTLPFWTVITAIRDFLLAPFLLAFRPLIVAIAFSAAAATTGRIVRFPETMYDFVAWQGVWVLGLAFRAVMMLALQSSYVSTSVLMFLPQDTFSASQWTFLEQLDCFAAVGWLGMLWSAHRRGQANWLVAILVCGFLMMMEATVSSSASLTVNLSMRMTLTPH